MSKSKHFPTEKQKQSYRTDWGKKTPIVDTINQQIQLHKLMKTQLLTDSNFEDDTKFKMDIFYSGKISALEDVLRMYNNQF